MPELPTLPTASRRGSDPAEAVYLARIGERVLRARASRGMTRKILSKASGVSERYLADFERGAGNASLLVIRKIAEAMGLPLADLVDDKPEPSPDLALTQHLLRTLSVAELAEARQLLTRRFRISGPGPKQRTALIGLRGAGKTTLGRKAAETLGVPFIELDREIEQAAGMELAEIFAVRGQAVFRKLEHACLTEVVARHGEAVIATGGSIVTAPETYALLLAACHVVWLRASPADHMARVVAQGDLRPMASSSRAMEDLEAILASRADLYAKADARIETSALSEPEALTALLTSIREAHADEADAAP